MAKKVALLVGVGDYGEGLKPLRCPVNGVEAMEAVLANPEIGGFDEVVPLVNPDVGEMRSRMGSLFASLSKDDLVLFYFTGHGIKDMNGKFYLSTTQTELFVNGRVNSGTAVEADFLRSVVGDCLALRKVVILDCCFGAAFADGFMGMDDSSIDVEAQIGAQASDARGWCVLTASTSTQYALEQADEELSVYTRYLVAGLRTGGAAPDGKEHISVGHLHAYVAAQVKEAAPAMDPAIFNAQQGAEIAIAKAVVDNEQRYRKQVQGKVRRGQIRPAARVFLDQWQQRLKLSVEQATAIEEEVLTPFRERQKHIEAYIKALKAEKAHTFPLDDEGIQDLKDLQRLLNLRDQDVSSAEDKILGNQIAREINDSDSHREIEKTHSSSYPQMRGLIESVGKIPCANSQTSNGRIASLYNDGKIERRNIHDVVSISQESKERYISGKNVVPVLISDKDYGSYWIICDQKKYYLLPDLDALKARSSAYLSLLYEHDEDLDISADIQIVKSAEVIPLETGDWEVLRTGRLAVISPFFSR